MIDTTISAKEYYLVKLCCANTYRYESDYQSLFNHTNYQQILVQSKTWCIG